MVLVSQPACQPARPAVAVQCALLPLLPLLCSPSCSCPPPPRRLAHHPPPQGTALLAIIRRGDLSASLAALTISEALDVTMFLKAAVTSGAMFETRFNSGESTVMAVQAVEVWVWGEGSLRQLCHVRDAL